MTRALITGCKSMTGSYLQEYLQANTDWEVHGVAHSEVLKKNGTLIECDLRAPLMCNCVIEQVRPDYVFHLVAASDTAASFLEPALFYEMNMTVTTRLLDAIRSIRLDPVVHICSSSEVFGRVDKDHGPIKEDARYHPASPYAISRVGTDLIGQFYAQAYAMKTVITRAFTHTGPRRKPVFAESAFAKQIALIEANKADPVIHVGNLHSTRTYCDVRDMARAYHLAVTVDPTPGVCYNIGGDYSCTIGRMLETLLGLSTRQKIDIVTDPAKMRPIDADFQVPDSSKFRAHTGWKPEIAFEQTMQDLLDYWREQVRE